MSATFIPRETRDLDDFDPAAPLDGQVPTWSGGRYVPAASLAGDLSYAFTQGTPAAVWTIAHRLGKKPSVTVVDSSDSVVVGDVAYLDLDTLTVTFAGAFSGHAYIN